MKYDVEYMEIYLIKKSTEMEIYIGEGGDKMVLHDGNCVKTITYAITPRLNVSTVKISNYR